MDDENVNTLMTFLIFSKFSKANIVLKNRLAASSFQDAIKFPIKLAQIFSYFPIYIGESEEQLEFKWLYWRCGYSLVTFLLFFTEFLFVVKDAFNDSLNLLSIKVVAFHLGAIVQYLLFFRLTYYWPDYVKEWLKVEFHMKSYEIVGNLRLKLACIVAGIMIIAGVEHGLVNAYKLKDCFDKEANISAGFKEYFTSTYTHIFRIIEYSFWMGLLIQFLNLQRSFYWNYTDVFIMIIGSALTFRMRQISKKVQDVAKIKVNDLGVWKTLRKDYTRLSELCCETNERLAGVIIVCFLMNLYFVLLQLYSSLEPMDIVIEKVYFYLSFGLLLLRIFCLCIFGGAVYEEWRNIKFHLSTINTAAYNMEVDRLINHVVSWELCLSGKNFFHISRGLILQMAGAIVTYELVLIQFYKND